MLPSIYLHIPFCTSRCAYCDFNTYAGLEALMPAYVEAVRAELRLVAEGLRLAPGLEAERTRVGTVFFGGGTPSLLPPDSIPRILACVREEFELVDDCEISVEANPGTVHLDTLSRLRRAGVNRLSFGVQSADPQELRLLERAHTFEDVIEAVRLARAAGFGNLNLDLIYGLPWQSLKTWGDTLERTLDLEPEHLSLYALSLEHGTPLRSWVERGLVAEPEADRAADMYEAAGASLARAGFVHYEISNWAKDGGTSGESRVPRYACRHNLQYWRNLPYLGIGAGAHGYALGWRYANVLSPAAYLRRIEHGRPVAAPCSPAVAQRRAVSPDEEMDDTLLLGFRLTREGVRRSGFRARFGQEAEARYGARLKMLEADGLIERGPDVLRLTRRGRLLGNRVFAAFV